MSGAVPRERHHRELVGVALWALAAVAWVAAMRVPWFREGLAASTSPMDAAELLRSGVFGVSSSAGFAVLVLPGLALVLLVLAPLRGVAVMVVRVLLWLLATSVGLTMVVALAQVSAATFGWGAALVVVGSVLGGAALTCATVRTG